MIIRAFNQTTNRPANQAMISPHQTAIKQSQTIINNTSQSIKIKPGNYSQSYPNRQSEADGKKNNKSNFPAPGSKDSFTSSVFDVKRDLFNLKSIEKLSTSPFGIDKSDYNPVKSDLITEMSDFEPLSSGSKPGLWNSYSQPAKFNFEGPELSIFSSNEVHTLQQDLGKTTKYTFIHFSCTF